MSVLKNIDLSKIMTPAVLLGVVKVVAYLVVGYVAIRVVVSLTRRILRGKVTEQVLMLVTKGLLYTGIVTLAVMVLLELGVNLTPLLGAAGIVGLAIGIASQASISNIISGLFLISEKPFSVGDVIRSGNVLGIVLSIDLLSVKIRTFDNLYVRVPNEKLATSELTTITRFPIRRLDFNLSVAFKEDLGKVRDILMAIAKNNPFCLDEPEPIMVLQNFGDSGIELLFGVWFSRTDYLQVKNSVFLEIKARFDAAGIEIPFPHRSLYAGSASDPFPVTIVAAEKE